MGGKKVSALVSLIASLAFVNLGDLGGIGGPAARPLAMAQSAAPDLLGVYHILQSRTLALTFTQGYFLQDGQVILPGQVNRLRVYCRADRGIYDDAFGAVEIFFSTAASGASRALLKTIPDRPQSQSTTIECLSSSPIRGFLDLQVALGRVVELTR